MAASQGRGGLGQGRLIDYAEELGLDRDEFSSCVAASTHQKTVADDQAEAAQLGIDSTPTLLINDTPVANPFNTDAIREEIDRIVGESRQE